MTQLLEIINQQIANYIWFLPTTIMALFLLMGIIFHIIFNIKLRTTLTLYVFFGIMTTGYIYIAGYLIK